MLSFVLRTVSGLNSFSLKNTAQKIFLFSKCSAFKFVTFSKNQQFGELFQKRFASGICDFRGAPRMYSFPPYTFMG